MTRCFRCGYPGGGPCPCGYNMAYDQRDDRFQREQLAMLHEIIRRLEKIEYHQYSSQTYKSEIKNQKNMKSLGVMMRKLLDSDTQTLVKAGYINGDLELTSEGTTALDSVIFDANKAALVALAQTKLDEESKK